MNYLIIGGSHAAIGAIEGIRTIDPTGSITLVSREHRPAYGRPLISYYLEGRSSLDQMDYRPAEFYDHNGVRRLLGRTVLSVDPNARTALLDGGQVLTYDRLLFACGSDPLRIPFEGLESVEHRFTFTTLDDALAIERLLTPKTRLLIVGAGLIGLKCAEGVLDRVEKVTVCDLADRVLPTVLDGDSAEPLRAKLESKGIRFFLGDSVARFEGNRALMKSGATVDFDLLVMAAGVRPNVALAKAAGAEVGRGIRIDDHAKTTLPDHYAAGDCAEGFDPTLGEPRVLAILPSAYLEGFTAGVNMAGGDAVVDGDIPMNSIGFFGYHIISAGSCRGECRAIGEGENRKKFYISEGKLVGFILLGEVARAGIYTSLIRDRVSLDEIDFESLVRAPELIALDRSRRIDRLARPR